MNSKKDKPISVYSDLYENYTIYDLANIMLRKSKDNDEIIRFRFNGITLTVDSSYTKKPEEIVNEYYKLLVQQMSRVNDVSYFTKKREDKIIQQLRENQKTPQFQDAALPTLDLKYRAAYQHFYDTASNLAIDSFHFGIIWGIKMQDVMDENNGNLSKRGIKSTRRETNRMFYVANYTIDYAAVNLISCWRHGTILGKQLGFRMEEIEDFQHEAETINTALYRRHLNVQKS